MYIGTRTSVFAGTTPAAPERPSSCRAGATDRVPLLSSSAGRRGGIDGGATLLSTSGARLRLWGVPGEERLAALRQPAVG